LLTPVKEAVDNSLDAAKRRASPTLRSTSSRLENRYPHRASSTTVRESSKSRFQIIAKLSMGRSSIAEQAAASKGSASRRRLYAIAHDRQAIVFLSKTAKGPPLEKVELGSTPKESTPMS